MRLNTLSAEGARFKKNRVGRGQGSKGKTCGRGHKGQRSRSGASQKLGFEGGQMPLQRRLPKFGFNSYLKTITEELRLSQLAAIEADVIDLNALKAANLIKRNTKRVKVIHGGELKKAVKLQGIHATAGATAAIEAAGGSFLD